MHVIYIYKTNHSSALVDRKVSMSTLSGFNEFVIFKKELINYRNNIIIHNYYFVNVKCDGDQISIQLQHEIDQQRLAGNTVLQT